MKRGDLIILAALAGVFAVCILSVADHWRGIQCAMRGFALREMGDVEPAHIIHRSHLPKHGGFDWEGRPVECEFSN